MSQIFFFFGNDDQLKSLIKDCIREVSLKPCAIAASPTYKKINESSLLTQQQVAIYCNFSTAEIDHLTRKGKLLPAMIGGKLRFFKSDVLRFLECNQA